MQEIFRHGQGLRRKVLVVDDELINRQLLGMIVGQEHDVIYAENGREALRQIRKHQETLSLVLLDLLMPEMDGYEVLRTMQTDAELRRIPIIVLTSEKDAEVESLHLGASDFIPKPYDMPEVIMARIDRSIELAEDSMTIREAEDDPLTGLYNKDFFLHYARQHDRYEPETPMDAIVLNVNRFHLINELYGRSLGDELLRAMAEKIHLLLNGTSGLACRSDSDTFYLYLPHREDYESALMSSLAAIDGTLGHAKITIRAGIYPNVDKSVDLEQRFDRANLACSRLRGNYLTACAYYDTRLHDQELCAERLIGEVDAALSEKQFKVFYQPKYHIQGDRPVLASAEALIRWFHPVHGMISPGVFIPLFEENGLISRLDHYVWQEAAVQIHRWKDQYGLTIPVSVNVSRVDIFDPNLEQELREIMLVNRLSPEEYLLEITESAYTDHSSQIIDTVARLREMGFRVEMDDFGSGYSSLNMLTALPIDALKLDMGFIRNIAKTEKDFRMVELMLDIARFLSVPVIAEGVETEEQYQLLKGAGCDIIQGYYFSKPLPPEEFNRLIEKELSERNS
ncbi:MAG: EAL domain-containing protein [Clostridia bacterium]|nr:EAL domain-containing protein [Clostridia bacterium]